MKYEDLPDDLRLRFDTYNVNIVIISDTDEDEVREMFLRLQNGTTLKAQERRNAMPGKMRDFIKDLAEHPFFASCNFTNARYTFDQLAAQMTLIELVGEPTNVKNADLNKMYERELEFDPTSLKARKIRRTLEYLRQAFPNRTPELERYSVISYIFSCRICWSGASRRTCTSNWPIGLSASKLIVGSNANCP